MIGKDYFRNGIIEIGLQDFNRCWQFAGTCPSQRWRWPEDRLDGLDKGLVANEPLILFEEGLVNLVLFFSFSGWALIIRGRRAVTCVT